MSRQREFPTESHSANGYMGSGDRIRHVDTDQLVRFMGYLAGFGYALYDSPNTDGKIDIEGVSDAFEVACEYTGYTQGRHTQEAWDEGFLAGVRAAARNAFEAGTRMYCEDGKGVADRYECGAMIDSYRHWIPETDQFLCPLHWGMYEQSKR